MASRRGRDRPINVPVTSDASQATAELEGFSETLLGLGQQGAQAASDLTSALGGLDVLGIGAGVGLAAGIAEGIEREALDDRLAGSLGLSETEARELGESVGAVYADGFGDSYAEVGAAVQQVDEDIADVGELGAAALQEITAEALTLADVFGEDLPAVTRATGQLLKNDLARDAGEALDVITAGFQGGANQAGDFLDTLEEYGPFFQQLGLDASQATDILVQGLDAGAFSADKVADAFKEFSIRVVDDSDTTNEALEQLGFAAGDIARQIARGGPDARRALGEITAELRNIEDPIEQNTLAVALFGTQVEDSTRQALLGIDVLTDGLDGTANAAGRLADQVGDNLATRLEIVKRRGFDAVTTGAEAAVPALELAVGAAEGVLDAFGALPAPVQSSALVLAGFLPVAGRVADAFGGIGASVSALRTNLSAGGGIGAAITGALGPANLAAIGLGAGLVALTAAVSAQAEAQRRAEARVRAGTDALRDQEGVVRLTDDAYSEFLATQEDLANPLSDNRTELARLGVTTDEVAEAVTGGADALAELRGELFDAQIAALGLSADSEVAGFSVGFLRQNFIETGGTTREFRDVLRGADSALLEISEDLDTLANDRLRIAEQALGEVAATAEGELGPALVANAEALARAEDGTVDYAEALRSANVNTIAADLGALGSEALPPVITGMEEATDETEAAADAFAGLNDEAETLDDNLREIRAAFDDLVGQERDAREAALDYGDAIDDLRRKSDGVNESTGSQKREFIAVERQMQRVVDKTLDHVAALQAQGASQDRVDAAIRKANIAIDESQRTTGLAATSVQLYRDQLNQIPTAVGTVLTVDADTSRARAELEAFTTSYPVIATAGRTGGGGTVLRLHDGGVFRSGQSGNQGLALLRDRERVLPPDGEPGGLADLLGAGGRAQVVNYYNYGVDTAASGTAALVDEARRRGVATRRN